MKDNKRTLEKLVHYYYHKYCNYLYMSDYDDLFQVACITLINSFWKYDPQKNISISKYVVYNIGSYIQCEIKKERRQCKGPNTIKIDMYTFIMNEKPNNSDVRKAEETRNKLIDFRKGCVQ